MKAVRPSFEISHTSAEGRLPMTSVAVGTFFVHRPRPPTFCALCGTREPPANFKAAIKVQTVMAGGGGVGSRAFGQATTMPKARRVRWFIER